jgi:hypothetical protein
MSGKRSQGLESQTVETSPDVAFFKTSSDILKNGAQADEVDEPQYGRWPVVSFEFEVYPETRALSPSELQNLCERFGSVRKVASVIGASESFVHQNRVVRRRSTRAIKDPPGL